MTADKHVHVDGFIPSFALKLQQYKELSQFCVVHVDTVTANAVMLLGEERMIQIKKNLHVPMHIISRI